MIEHHNTDLNCTLCFHATSKMTFYDDQRVYCHCENCGLISVKSDDLPSMEQEKERYLLHNNGPQNSGHVVFLNRVVQPALKYIDSSMNGLDIGCGPVPVISKILAKEGIKCDNHDPLFDFMAKYRVYDFIFCTEAMEHFHKPETEFYDIAQRLNSGGLLFLMTEIWIDLHQFENWYYKRDNTHVSFYSSKTFDYIQKKYGFKMLESDSSRVFLLQKI